MVRGFASRFGRLHWTGIVLVAAAIIGVVYLWRSQGIELEQAKAARVESSALGARVQVVPVIQGPSERAITLLADVRPFASATLYGKVSGYLRAVKVDKGDVVKAGQVVAEIDAAETDQQYHAAVADLENKKRVAARSRELLSRGNVSVQNAENADTSERMAQALVRQLETMRSYELLRAPFAGVVVARYADPGALIQNAASSQTNSLPVVTIADLTKLRVSAYVPQQDVPFVRVGSPAEVYDATNPQRRLKATISRTSGSLDPLTRTLLVEVDVDNADSFLVPGSFAYMTLQAPVESYARIPVNALITRGRDRFAAVVGDDSKIAFRPITVASSDGNTVDVSDGLKVGERVAINIADEVTDGSRVQVVTPPARR